MMICFPFQLCFSPISSVRISMKFSILSIKYNTIAYKLQLGDVKKKKKVTARDDIRKWMITGGMSTEIHQYY